MLVSLFHIRIICVILHMRVYHYYHHQFTTITIDYSFIPGSQLAIHCWTVFTDFICVILLSLHFVNFKFLFCLTCQFL